MPKKWAQMILVIIQIGKKHRRKSNQGQTESLNNCLYLLTQVSVWEKKKKKRFIIPFIPISCLCIYIDINSLKICIEHFWNQSFSSKPSERSTWEKECVCVGQIVISVRVLNNGIKKSDLKTIFSYTTKVFSEMCSISIEKCWKMTVFVWKNASKSNLLHTFTHILNSLK